MTLLYDQKCQMFLLSSRLKQTYFYELQAWCLKISAGGPLCYKSRLKWLKLGYQAYTIYCECGERVCLKLIDVLLLLFKSGQPQWLVMTGERFLPPQIIYWNLLSLFLYLLWSRQFLMHQKCSSSKQEAVLSCCHGTWNAKMAWLRHTKWRISLWMTILIKKFWLQQRQNYGLRNWYQGKHMNSR